MIFESKDTSRPIRQYRVRKDLPRSFFPTCGSKRLPEADATCDYKPGTDSYHFNGGLFLRRRVVEAWVEYFEPVKEKHD